MTTCRALVYDLSRYRGCERVLRICEDTPLLHRDWKQLDARITELGRERAAHEREVCACLLSAERLALPKRLGFASLREYAMCRLGLNGRKTEERLRVGQALESLPVLGEALAKGELFWSAVRELTRVAVPETEQAWRDWARGEGLGAGGRKSVKEVEKAVSGRTPGDLPSDAPDPALITYRLSFEVRAETMALFRELQAAIREEVGGDADDDLILHELVRRARGGGDEDGGRAPYQVSVSRCDRCREVAIDAAGERHPVDTSVQEMIACDAQDVGCADARPHVGAASVGASARGGASAAPRKRATQSVPPATRRAVLSRSGRCCSVPGCRNSRHLHVHHTTPRSEGGNHDPVGLISLCHRHHASAHDGTLRIVGDAERGFRFEHADGTAYGQPLCPADVEVAQQAYAALRHLGFKHTHAEQLIATVQSQGAPQTVEAFLTAALRMS